jgi:hypothetical protein
VYQYKARQEAVAEKRPPYQLTKEQDSLLCKIIHIIEVATENVREDSNQEEEEDSSDKDKEEEEEEEEVQDQTTLIN